MNIHVIGITVLATSFAIQPLVGLAQTPEEKPAAKSAARMQMDPKLQGQMMERMKIMQAQMEKIRQTADPKEREKLLTEHMKSMQEGMQMMRGTGGGMMGMKGGGIMGGGGPHSAQSAQMMEGRIDMMQMMMDQMLQHEQMMRQPSAK